MTFTIFIGGNMPDRAKFEMIPCIYAGDLPMNVSYELGNFYDDKICLHGGGGCVFYFHVRDIDRLPLFAAWIVEAGIITQVDLANMPSIERFCNKIGIALENATSSTYRDYHYYCGGRKDYIKLAMQGT
jgi:hypothetical protein